VRPLAVFGFNDDVVRTGIKSSNVFVAIFKNDGTDVSSVSSGAIKIYFQGLCLNR